MMDLFKFPLDDQICSMEIASFSKTTSELVLKWDETSPVRMYQGLKLPQFRIRSVKASHCKEEFHIGTCTHYSFTLDLLRNARWNEKILFPTAKTNN
jgi:Neurotransmitter-gated ion-channel ligand binding domain